MDDNTIRARIVVKLHRQGEHQPNGMVSVEGAASMSVPASDEGRAKDLLTNEMVSDPDCPVQWAVAGRSVVLERDDDKIARYIERYGGSGMLPWDLS